MPRLATAARHRGPRPRTRRAASPLRRLTGSQRRPRKPGSSVAVGSEVNEVSAVAVGSGVNEENWVRETHQELLRELLAPGYPRRVRETARSAELHIGFFVGAN